MLGFAFKETMFSAMIDIFCFKNDAVNSLEVEFETTSNRHSEVIGKIHESSFTEDGEEVRNDRSADLQRCIVLDLGIAIVHLVKNVAAVAELDFEQFETRKIVEVEHKAEITTVEVCCRAD